MPSPTLHLVHMRLRKPNEGQVSTAAQDQGEQAAGSGASSGMRALEDLDAELFHAQVLALTDSAEHLVQQGHDAWGGATFSDAGSTPGNAAGSSNRSSGAASGSLVGPAAASPGLQGSEAAQLALGTLGQPDWGRHTQQFQRWAEQPLPLGTSRDRRLQAAAARQQAAAARQQAAAGQRQAGDAGATGSGSRGGSRGSSAPAAVVEGSPPGLHNLWAGLSDADLAAWLEEELGEMLPLGKLLKARAAAGGVPGSWFGWPAGLMQGAWLCTQQGAWLCTQRPWLCPLHPSTGTSNGTPSSIHLAFV